MFGETGRSLHDRIRQHMYSIAKNEKTIRTHFNSKEHNHLDTKVTVIEKVIPNTTTVDSLTLSTLACHAADLGSNPA